MKCPTAIFGHVFLPFGLPCWENHKKVNIRATILTWYDVACHKQIMWCDMSYPKPKLHDISLLCWELNQHHIGMTCSMYSLKHITIIICLIYNGQMLCCPWQNVKKNWPHLQPMRSLTNLSCNFIRWWTFLFPSFTNLHFALECICFKLFDIKNVQCLDLNVRAFIIFWLHNTMPNSWCNYVDLS